MTIDELRVLLDAYSEAEFVDNQLLLRRPWIFETDDIYDTWRRSVAATLGIVSENVRIVGSAATGFSLSPLKPGRPFRRTSSLDRAPSDIDVAVIDPSLFDLSWNTIVLFDRRRSLGGTDEGRNRIRVNVYWGLVGQRDLPWNTEPARVLLQAMVTAQRSAPIRGHQVRGRIYRRIEDLRAYHISSLRQLRAQLSVEQEKA